MRFNEYWRCWTLMVSSQPADHTSPCSSHRPQSSSHHATDIVRSGRRREIRTCTEIVALSSLACCVAVICGCKAWYSSAGGKGLCRKNVLERSAKRVKLVNPEMKVVIPKERSTSTASERVLMMVVIEQRKE